MWIVDLRYNKKTLVLAYIELKLQVLDALTLTIMMEHLTRKLEWLNDQVHLMYLLMEIVSFLVLVLIL